MKDTSLGNIGQVWISGMIVFMFYIFIPSVNVP